MKCTICGKVTLPGAMLCGPCRAALKRARYVSIQAAPPASLLQGRPQRARNPATIAVPIAPPPSAVNILAAHAAATTPSVRTRLVGNPLARALALGAIAFAALATVAYYGQAPGPETAPGTDATAAVTVPAARPAPAADANGPVVDAPITTATSGGDAAPVDMPPAHLGEVNPPVAPAKPRTPLPSGPRKGGPTLTAEQGGDAYGPMAEPPRAAPAAPPPAPAPPPPDRWQTMNEELARCEREGGFGGFICGQKVRINVCEGYWGRTPQCPVPPENPRGQ